MLRGHRHTHAMTGKPARQGARPSRCAENVAARARDGSLRQSRYAAGEIDEDEYLRRLAGLSQR